MEERSHILSTILGALVLILSLQICAARSTKSRKVKKTEIPVQLSIDGNKFTSIGCFRDAWNRVIPALEGEHQLLMEPNYKARKFALLKCARAAMDKRLKVFGMENGGQCFGASDERSLNKYGTAVECRRDGKGGPWSLQAYRFVNLPINGAFSPWSRWTTCSKTCDHGVRRRMRTCSNPSPSNGGKDCSGLGPSVEGEICKDKECPTMLVDDAENARASRLSTTPQTPAATPHPSKAADSKEGPTTSNSEQTIKTPEHKDNYMISPTKPINQETTQEGITNSHADTQSFRENSDKINPVLKQKPKEAPKESSNEPPSESLKEEPKEAFKESPGEAPKVDHSSNHIIISGEAMPAPNHDSAREQPNDKPKEPESHMTEKQDESPKPKPSNIQSDFAGASQGLPAHGPNHRFPSTSSEPYQFIDEPEDLRVNGNPYLEPSMHQSEGIKSHEQINTQETAQEIDPSVVEDTYNGGPVVPSSAVQMNTPLGPVVMGEMSSLNSNFNPNEVQSHEQQPARNEECFCPKKVCEAKADIAFLVDGSSDIPQVYFAHVLDFMKALTRGFSSKDTQVNLVAYGDDAASAFTNFSPVQNIHEIDDSIDSMTYMGGDPRTGNALMKVEKGLFKTSGRSDAKHALILLTSGSSSDNALQAADELRKSGIKLTTIGLGKLANVKELIDISSEPKSSHVFTAFLDTLPDIMDDIVKGVCSDIDGTLFNKNEPCVCGANKDKSSKDKSTDSLLESNKAPENMKEESSDNKDLENKTKNESKQSSSDSKEDKNGERVDEHNKVDNGGGKDNSGHNIEHNNEEASTGAHVSPWPQSTDSKKETKDQKNEGSSASLNSKEQSSQESSGSPSSKDSSKGETSEKLKSDAKIDPPTPQENNNEKAVPKKDDKSEDIHSPSQRPSAFPIEMPSPFDQEKGASENIESHRQGPNALDTSTPEITILDNGYSQLMREKQTMHAKSNEGVSSIGVTNLSPTASSAESLAHQPSQNQQQSRQTNQENKTQEKILQATESSSRPKTKPDEQQQGMNVQGKPSLTSTEGSYTQVNVPLPTSKTKPDPNSNKNGLEDKGKNFAQMQGSRRPGNNFVSGTNEQDKISGFKENIVSKECSVNLGVVLDSKTTAYGEDNHAKKLLLFAKKLTHLFPVTPEGNRVGMMVYSGSPKLKVVHFDHSLDPNTMDKAIDSASYLNMEIKTGKVLNFAQEHLFSRIPSGKANVLLLITDGVSYDDVTTPATELKRRGVEIFVVGVGDGVISKELESIASEPLADHVIKTSYDFTEPLLEDIKLKICSSTKKKGNDAFLPRRRGHLYRVLTEIERRRK